jgi:hypothetical protein
MFDGKRKRCLFLIPDEWNWGVQSSIPALQGTPDTPIDFDSSVPSARSATAQADESRKLVWCRRDAMQGVMSAVWRATQARNNAAARPYVPQ